MKINLIVIYTAFPEKLAAFYKKLGLQFVYHRHGKGAMHYSADINEVIFEIYPLLQEQSPIKNPVLRLGFSISNLDAFIQKLLADTPSLILQLPKQTKWGHRAVIQDLDGRKIELVEG